MKLAIFASGQGSNAQVLIEQAQAGTLGATIEILISDQLQAGALANAQQAGIEARAFSPKAFADKHAYEQAVLACLREHQVDALILAGYMRLIGPTLLAAYPERIINTHPSLLPAFPGKDAVGQALAAHATHAGVTVHYIDAGMDTGPIIAQQRVKVMPHDDHDTLTARIKAAEHALYPACVHDLMTVWSRSQ